MAYSDLKLNCECNNRCIFCGSTGKPEYHFPPEKVREAVLDARGRGSGCITLSGGEPTLRADLCEIVSFVRGLGLRVSLQTNARALSDAGLARRLVACGLGQALVSMHAHNRGLYGRMCGSDGFEEACAGLRNLLSLGVAVSTNTVVSSLNYRALPKIIEFIIGEFPGLSMVTLGAVQPAGSAAGNFNTVVPKFSEAAPFVIGTIELCASKGYPVYVADFPLCFLSPYEDRAEGAQDHEEVETIEFKGQSQGIEYRGRRKSFKASNLMRKGGQCTVCAEAGACSGVYAEYAERYGLRELKPVVK